MTQILLLTKNSLNEQNIEEQLRKLGHEVFSSKILLDEFLLNNDKLIYEALTIFEVVIISETVDNSELSILLKVLKKYNLTILRKTDETMDKTKEKEWRDKGISNFISRTPELEILREKLKFEGKKKSCRCSEKKKLSISTLGLSRDEIKLFCILYGYKRVVSRDELCMKMWNEKKSNSRMSQLSALTNKLKLKMSKFHIEGVIIETIWGRGYKLASSLYDQIEVDIDELERIII
ncbi:winged helix-turn-helix domain-containing protein [Enterococcus faecium]|uniref:OmpR/PhoB-type domain-containing protein n=1 Tax=Enterococcus faecium TaxID=1352 RepID=A0A242B049_ENTFC|nr:winged helix-turn-helix domain-containing protein [Enterococcus faecium]OTN86683.1 hypothetical protein A5810_002972 [Enterococcus faecium]